MLMRSILGSSIAISGSAGLRPSPCDLIPTRKGLPQIEMRLYDILYLVKSVPTRNTKPLTKSSNWFRSGSEAGAGAAFGNCAERPRSPRLIVCKI